MRAFRPPISTRRRPSGSPPAAAAPAPIPPQPEVGVPGHPRHLGGRPGSVTSGGFTTSGAEAAGSAELLPERQRLSLAGAPPGAETPEVRSGGGGRGAHTMPGPAAAQAPQRGRRRCGRAGGAAAEAAPAPLPPHPPRTGGEEPPADGPLDGERRRPLPRAGRAPRRAEPGRARRGVRSGV